ncbi:MAG: hypothetical protein GX945_15710 [Lentisphaerae bacterium]|nr:hypothetical protein [Lentisphaerota bacterium]
MKLRKYLIVALCCCVFGLVHADWDVSMDINGRFQISKDDQNIATVSAGYYLLGWRGRSFAAPNYNVPPEGLIEAVGGAADDPAKVAMRLKYDIVGDNSIQFHYTLTPTADLEANTLYAIVSLEGAFCAGRPYFANRKELGVLPAEQSEKIHIFSQSAEHLAVDTTAGLLSITVPVSRHILLQDSRQWGSNFSIRIGAMSDEGQTWKANTPYVVAFTLTLSEKINFERDVPFTLTANEDWIPLDTKLDIEPGSALDLSGVLKHDAPAGKHGYLRAVGPNFEFENLPGVPQRFYGVNFCFSAHNITPEESEILAERLFRLGYNAVRYHHYERNITIKDIPGDSTQLHPERMAQFDAMFAAMKKRGLYATTDTYVSRDVYNSEIWPGMEGMLATQMYKRLCLINDNAFENLKKFTRNLLTHVNPHTGLSYAKDPSLTFICLINEGLIDTHMLYRPMEAHLEAEWLRAWNDWLKAKYPSKQARDAAWGREVAEELCPLPRSSTATPNERRDLDLFFAEKQISFYKRMKDFIRNELGCKALLSDMNNSGKTTWAQIARDEYDYVDDHFYVDHPQFIKEKWRLPSRCNNDSVVKRGVMGGSHCGYIRHLDKPMTITEWNYSGPGRYRGVGGILTGCMAALQNWDGLWRFAYSHGSNMFAVRSAGYFDLVSDPLNQAADRASLCLYLRGDLGSAERTVAITMDKKHLADERNVPRASVVPAWQNFNAIAQVGIFVDDSGAKVPADVSLGLSDRAPKAAIQLTEEARSPEAGQALDALFRKKGWLPAGNRSNLSENITESVNGQFMINAPEDTMILNTPRTAGGFAPAGQVISTDAVTITILDTDATVWVSSLSDEPIVSSKRLLLSHLTDLQNEGARFMEKARKTTLGWGKAQHLVRNGRAKVALRLAEPAKATVWQIDLSGKRLAKLPSSVVDGALSIDLAVKGDFGAQMLYEISVE